MSRFFSKLLFLIFACSTVSCGLIDKVVEKPKVSLENVGLNNVTGSGATLVFGIKVDNPNPFAIRVDALDYNLEIGGKPFSKGLIDKPSEVGANASSVISIPVAVKYSDIFSSVVDLINKGSRPYRIHGEAKLSFFSIPFNHTGELKLN